MSNLNSLLLGVYVHVPVCRQKCAYCDFYSLGGVPLDHDFWSRFLDRLLRELDFKRTLVDQPILGSIFFGGGTPSLAPGWWVTRVIQEVKERFARHSKRLEISLEANPESLTPEWIAEIAEAGANRITLGVQTRDEKLLSYLNRKVSISRIEKALEDLGAGEIQNYGADLIYGIPGQKFSVIQEDANFLIEGGVSHLSAYCLGVEPGTALQKMIETGERKTISLRRQSAHMEQIVPFLEEKGYRRYEISNFARPGLESLHNLLYWKYRPYLGLGPGAHSFLSHMRRSNEPDLQHYLESDPGEDHMDVAIAFPEIYIGATRLTRRQGFALFRKNLSEDLFHQFLAHLQAMEQEGWVRLDRSGFTITREGAMMGDTLLTRLSAIE